MIKLRELEEKDASLMIEWMHDPDIQKMFKKDMMSATLESAEDFCRRSKISKVVKNGDSLHFAVVDENDEYLGTISLKEIDLDNKTAEYAIILRKKAQGKGLAKMATGLVLEKAFSEYGLHRVYLNVFADNEVAIRLYKRCGFSYEGEFREHLKVRGVYVNWKWYGILENEFDKTIFE